MTVEPFLFGGIALFLIGSVTVLVRRDLLVMIMGLELMLSGASLTFVTYGRLYHVLSGQIIAFLVMAVAACEATIGLALLMGIFRTLGETDVTAMHAFDEHSLADP